MLFYLIIVYSTCLLLFTIVCNCVIDLSYVHVHVGINSINCYDVCETGIPDIILGRADGVVEVYSMDENNQPQIQVTHVWWTID